MKQWFIKNKIKNGDELVLQIPDNKKFIYRLLKEEGLLKMTKEFQRKLDDAKDDNDLNNAVIQNSKENY
ncbi:MAG: hypothetical protein Kow0098_28200 [Ignavibacteriaceae bacterium]